MEEFMDLTPSPAMLLADRVSTLTWKEALGELVDNALDAGAKHVEIVFDKRSLTVSDDGRGCKDVTQMLTKGVHSRSATTTLGQYGVGLKDAAAWLWGSLTVESVHKGIQYIATVNWERLAKQKEWRVPPPVQKPSPDTPSGVRLSFSSIKRHRPKLPPIAEELGKTFFPAIAQGKQVMLRGSKRDEPIVCQPITLPPFEESVEDDFEVDGHKVKLRIGIVKTEYANPLCGFLFIYGHRVINESALGAEGKSVKRVCGIVELGKGWILARNKNNIVDERQQGALRRAIHERISSLLDRAAQQTQLLCGEVFNATVNSLFRGALNRLAQQSPTAESAKTTKEKRDSPTNETGAKTPKNTGRKRGAKKKQPGERFADGAKQFLENGGRIEWRPMERMTTGMADIPGSVIWLNENNPDLQVLRAEEDSRAILQLALSMFAAEMMDSEQRDKFPTLRDLKTFPEVLAGVLSVVATTTDSQLVAT